MAAIFCLRVALGLMAALVLLAPAQVNPRFYRAQFWIVLGLVVAAALFARDSTGAALWIMLGAAMALIDGTSTASAQEQTPPAPVAPEPQTSLRCRALQVAVINAPIIGGQWELAIPGTSLSDRLLDIVVIEDMDIGKLGRIIAHFFGPKDHAETPVSNGEKQTFTHHPAELTGIPGIHHVQARGVTIITSADPRDATLDGEVRGQTPMYVHVADERLRVMVPDQAGTS